MSWEGVSPARFSARRTTLAVCLVTVAMWIGSCSSTRRALGPDETDLFCQYIRESYPSTTWLELRPGDQLKRDDAVLTCGSSGVALISNRSFGMGLQWEGEEGYLRTTIPGSSLIIVSSHKSLPSNGGKLLAKVTIVQGRVYYSTGRALRAEPGLIDVVKRGSGEVDRKVEEMLSDLVKMEWGLLQTGQDLGPWDMLWTGDHGRVEVEMLDAGGYRLIDGSVAVTDALGRLTNKIRVGSNAYLILHPDYYGKVRVTGIIGEVYVARNPEEVMRFYSLHQSMLWIYGIRGAADYQRWLEMLRKGQLE